jgi:branched-chain amino acid transport system substrate-binding protein
MSFKRKFLKVISGLTMASMVLAACSSGNEENSSSSNSPSQDTPAAESGTIKVGAVLPMTGSSSVFGQKFKDAYSLALDEINEAGGVKGKKLEVVIEDSQEKPNIGKTATEKLVSNEEILMLTGGRSSGVTLVEAQVAEENKMPYLIDHGSSDLATMSGYEYVYRLNPTAGMYTNALRDYWEENPPKSVAHVNVDNAYGEAVYDYGLKKYFEANPDIQYDMFKYKAGELDLKPIMEQVKAKDPQIVIMTAGDDNDATQLIKAAKEANLEPELFIGTGGGHSIIGFANQAGELTDTVLTAGPWHGNKKDPKWKEFFDKFTEKFGHEPGEHEVEAYSAIYVIADVLNRAENLDRESVNKALDGTDMDTIFGHIKFEDFDGYNNQNRGMSDVSQWMDGKLKTVYPTEYAESEIIPFPGWK